MFGKLKKNIINIPGKKIDRKLLAFESDDWGTIRIPDKKSQSYLVQQKLISFNNPFSAYDALETDNDFEALFTSLSKFRDSSNHHPVITANTVVANPDFEKIKAGGFSTYYFQKFTETYKNSKNSVNAFELFKKGIADKIIYPQFHAREHVNLPMWMSLLQRANRDFLTAFEMGCFSIDFIDKTNPRNNLMASYDYHSDEHFKTIKQSIEEGLQLFEEIFGFNSQSTVAPCYVWDKQVEAVFKANQVNYLQGSRFQNIPVKGSKKLKKRFHYNGEMNEYSQQYFQRNGLFEPSLNRNIDWVDKSLESISIAFKWRKPAIIGVHRLNFSGGLDEGNRTKNLHLMEALLNKVLQNWPDIEFVPSRIIHDLFKI